MINWADSCVYIYESTQFLNVCVYIYFKWADSNIIERIENRDLFQESIFEF